MHNILTAFADFLFPRYCLICGNHLSIMEREICIHCNMDLPRTFLWENAKENNLVKKFYGKATIHKAAAFIYYHAHSDTANLFYSFKYGNEPHVAVEMGTMAAKEMVKSGFFDNIDCLIPVPLNKHKEKLRGYNQSEKLAYGISKATGIKIVRRTITRKKHTASQTRMNAFERQDNMDNVFELTQQANELMVKHCLLIDDVITTGATIGACARTLSAIDNVSVSIFALGCVKDKNG